MAAVRVSGGSAVGSIGKLRGVMEVCDQEKVMDKIHSRISEALWDCIEGPLSVYGAVQIQCLLLGSVLESGDLGFKGRGTPPAPVVFVSPPPLSMHYPVDPSAMLNDDSMAIQNPNPILGISFTHGSSWGWMNGSNQFHFPSSQSVSGISRMSISGTSGMSGKGNNHNLITDWLVADTMMKYASFETIV